MQPFEYAAPLTISEAVALLAGGPGSPRALAGGTDLITQLREGRRAASLLVDLKRIPELNQVSFDPAHGLRIGAAVPCAVLQKEPAIQTHYPMLAHVCSLIGSYQIQNRASLGGNLCNAAPSADGIPPLIVLGARVLITGPTGERAVSAEHFCTGPGQHVLHQGEIVTGLLLPPPAPRSGAVYQRFIPRNEMDIAVAGAASFLQLSEAGRITRAVVALSAVAPTPLRVRDLEPLLQDAEPSEALFAEAGRIAAAACSPISDVRGSADYRRHLVGVLTRRTLNAALQMARG